MGIIADEIKNGKKQAEQPTTPPTTPVVEQPAAQPQEKIEITPTQPIITPEQKVDANATMRKPLEQPSASGFAKVKAVLDANNAANAAEKNEELRKRQQRRENRNKLFSALGDGIAAFSNLYFASQGAPSVKYEPRGSLSARASERRDKLEAQRKEDAQLQYLRDKAARDYELRRMMEERLRDADNYRKEKDEATAQAKKEEGEAKRQADAANIAQKFENQTKLNEQKGKIRKEEIELRGKQASDLESQKQGNKQKKAQEKPDKSAEAVAEKFYSLPEDVRQAAFDKYKNVGATALTPTQMQQAIGEYNATKKPKTKADYAKYRTKSGGQSSKRDYSQYKE